MDEMERYEVDGLLIIVPKDDKKIPLDCPHCGLAFSTREDVLSYKMFECCEECNLVHRNPNLEKWNSGWRPKKSNSSSRAG